LILELIKLEGICILKKGISISTILIRVFVEEVFELEDLVAATVNSYVL
jgi:hypothetical protein